MYHSETRNQKVESSIFINYFKACNIKLIILYFLLYILGNTSKIVSSFWLSNWTDQFESKSTDNSFQFGVFFALGFVHCNFFTIILLKFYFY
jgi:hypothetical protein